MNRRIGAAHSANRACRGNTTRPVVFLLPAICFALYATVGNARVDIRARGGAQQIAHDGQDAPQVFPEVTWRVHAVQEPAGATAQWICGPFRHVSDPTCQVDCRLDLRLRQGGGPPQGWSTIVPNGQTDVASGDLDAMVIAQTRRRNSVGQMGLTVTFLQAQFSTLAAGAYTTTVVGTIAGN